MASPETNLVKKVSKITLILRIGPLDKILLRQGHLWTKSVPDTDRPGKSCISSASRKLRILQRPQNSVIRDKVQRETWVLNIGVA